MLREDTIQSMLKKNGRAGSKTMLEDQSKRSHRIEPARTNKKEETNAISQTFRGGNRKERRAGNSAAKTEGKMTESSNA